MHAVPETIQKFLNLQHHHNNPFAEKLMGYCNIKSILDSRAFLMEDGDSQEVVFNAALRV